MSYTPQVIKEHYDVHGYDSLQRFISYYTQKEEVLRLCKNLENPTVLEIGKGSGFLSEYLKKEGVGVKTFDIAQDLGPDYVGDVLSLSQVVKEKFDIVCAFEILEHIRYEDVPRALEEIAQTTSRYAIISVPQSGFRFSFWSEFSHYFALQKFFQLPALRKPNFTGEHYWELARRGYTVSAFRQLLEKYFGILKEHTEPLNSHHRFYILEKLPHEK